MIYCIGYLTEKYTDSYKMGDVFKENENFKFDEDNKGKKWYVLSHKQELQDVVVESEFYLPRTIKTSSKVLHSICLTDNRYGVIGKQDASINNKPYDCIDIPAVVNLKNGQALDINDKLTVIKFQTNYIFIFNGISIC